MNFQKMEGVNFLNGRVWLVGRGSFAPKNETTNNKMKRNMNMKRNTNKTTNTIVSVLALAGFTALLWGGIQSGFADEIITISATPTASSGTNGLCPGGYIGYVSYTKSFADGWGWAPTNSVHTITDTNRTNTKVEFQGLLHDSGCNQTTVTVPNPTVSPKYRFEVYFTNNLPTNAYTIELKGFSP